ncbi:30S ribosomal protein S15 [Raphidocelis subcapitata]|uniref:30S ribosomal protein S15 n=1 Tax=Raphidocelis subcapitata TaxID=307507 RepID=A0A2V0NJT0_9CHLO|nr:30S ribosomal protein S15 [Raphidocelis subcapitata]|eukprot:GBF87501.1 30S ribosomal protein S15 [Raphidocelis subcapitata]
MASLCGRRAGVFGPATGVRAPRVERARLAICASFKNKENINLDNVPKYKSHDNDAGSTQVQVARLSARIEQISTHLRANRKDYSSKRGLEAVLSQRKRLLRYLYRTDRPAYDKVITELGIRSVIAGDSHKAAQRSAAAAAK